MLHPGLGTYTAKCELVSRPESYHTDTDTQSVWVSLKWGINVHSTPAWTQTPLPSDLYSHRSGCVTNPSFMELTDHPPSFTLTFAEKNATKPTHVCFLLSLKLFNSYQQAASSTKFAQNIPHQAKLWLSLCLLQQHDESWKKKTFYKERRGHNTI